MDIEIGKYAHSTVQLGFSTKCLGFNVKLSKLPKNSAHVSKVQFTKMKILDLATTAQTHA